MSKTYARIIDHDNGNGEVVQMVAEIFTPPEHDGVQFALSDCFHVDVAAQFVECPVGTAPGATYAGGAFTNPPEEPQQAKPEVYPELTPMAFYLAFSPAERIAIKGSADVMVKEFWETYELAAQTNHPVDPNLVSVQSGLDYLTTAGILAQGRKADILRGVPQ